MVTSFQKRFFLLIGLLIGGSLHAASLAIPITEPLDAFAWQNKKHFTATMKQFSELAEKEYLSILDRTIREIGKSEAFFKRSHGSLIGLLQETIFHWMIDDVLTQETYYSEEEECVEQSDDDFDSDEDPWRVAVMRGFEQDEKDSCDSDDDEYASEDPDASLARFEAEFEAWKIRKILTTLEMFLESSEEFTQSSIDIDTIKKFLNDCGQNGYSWLINELAEGSLEIGNNFGEGIYERAGIKRDLLLKIFGSLWFDYDWEKFDIEDELFVAKTFKATLLDLRNGRNRGRVKEHIIQSIVQIFSFDEKDFEKPLSGIRKNYNKYVQQSNWLGALIEWSIYCVYRKHFKVPPKGNGVLAFPLVEQLNKEAHLTKSMEDAHTNAQKAYKKVYLHEDTSKLVFIDKKGRRGELELAEKLATLKSIGKSYEPRRPRKKENVFVPQLYIIVQKKGIDPQFIEIPLKADELELPNRPLTRKAADKVFEEEGTTGYFAQAKIDYVKGRSLQGKTLGVATSEINKTLSNPVGKNTDLIHSERVLMEVLRKRQNIKHMVNFLAKTLNDGSYTVHGVVMLGYSTNSICPNCTPTLITLMNSHKPGEFMHMLVEELGNYEGSVALKLPVSKEASEPVDWTQFRMNVFVTAKIPFQHDSQACETTEKRALSNAAAPGPHAPLYFPNNEFIVSKIPQRADDTPDKNQRFFYEFVGDDVHEGKVYKGTSPNILCSSGSTVWKK